MKRKLALALCSSVVFLSISSGLLASVAWFKIANSVIVGVSGSFVEEYFHCGNGSSEDPFVITRPIHYYHLVEFFQRETNLPAPINADFGTDYLYFQVGYDLDNDGDLEVYNYDNQGIYQGDFEHPSYSETLNMAYYSDSNALMPIGTNEVPFIGSFDGNASEGISISNLNIHCAESVVIDGNQVDRAASDIGIFGYVADEDTGHTKTVIKNSNFNGLTIDLTEASNVVNPSTTSVVHTSTHAGHAYVGYIAGHVHTYTNYNATGPVNASPLYDVYVSNATILGGAGVTCNFGYIGLVDSVDTNTSVTVTGEVSSLNGEGGGGGQGNNWGGSINIKELNLRIYNMMNVTTNNGIATDDPSTHHPTASTNNSITTITSGKTILSKLHKMTNNSADKNGGHRYYTDDYNSVTLGLYGTGYASNSKMNLSPTSNQVLYSFEDSGTKTNTYSGTYTTVVPGTMLPLLVNDKSNGYSTLESNTGYIVGGTTTSSGNYNYQSVTTVRTASSPLANIVNSINSSSAFNNNKLEIISNSSATYNASNYGRIDDEYNHNNSDVSSTLSKKYSSRTIQASSLKKYAASRSTLGSVLSGSTFIHGLHFTGKAISTSYKETLDTAYVNDQVKTNYELPKHSIDFNLKEKGYINFFAGSYQNATVVADSFFSLYTVSRSGSSISNILEISKIYKNNNAATKDEYPHLYLLKNGTTYTTGAATLSASDAGALEFDCQFLWADPPVDGAIYYFEIPVNPGEYAMGCPSNGATQGSYLMYLDIGASGEEQVPVYNEENAIRDAPLFTQIDFQTDGFVYNSCFNVAYVIPTGSTKEKFAITISCGSVTHEGDEYTCYFVNIINTSGNSFTISALLMDNDDDNDNDYYYMYEITYNGGTPAQYFKSNSFTGLTGAQTMTPAYS